MLLMFVIGSANIGWMLALAAVMATEKNLPAGHRLAPPIGAALLVAAVWIAVAATLEWPACSSGWCRYCGRTKFVLS